MFSQKKGVGSFFSGGGATNHPTPTSVRSFIFENASCVSALFSGGRKHTDRRDGAAASTHRLRRAVRRRDYYRRDYLLRPPPADPGAAGHSAPCLRSVSRLLTAVCLCAHRRCAKPCCVTLRSWADKAAAAATAAAMAATAAIMRRAGTSLNESILVADCLAAVLPTRPTPNGLLLQGSSSWRHAEEA